MILAVTGHRPQKLGGYQMQPRLCSFAERELPAQEPSTVITGMALGWDQAVAAACVQIGIPFVAAIPCRGQESKWPKVAQEEYWRLLGHASDVFYITDGPYSAACMQTRNEWLVDYSNKLLALWDGSSGGTRNCVLYASGKVPVEHLWKKWEHYRTTLAAVFGGSQ